MKNKLTILFAALVTMVGVATVAQGAGGDQGKRLTPPFCIGNQTAGDNAGVVRSVAKGQKCRSYEHPAKGLPVSAKGDKGERGEKGDAGPVGAASSVPGPAGAASTVPGPAGKNGSDGKDGLTPIVTAISEQSEKCTAGGYDFTLGDETSTICNGLDGNPGDDGSDGLSAYQVWLGLGNEGSEQDFIDSLKGAKGDPGDNGKDGADGAPGAPGADGSGGLGNGTGVLCVSEGGNVKWGGADGSACDPGHDTLVTVVVVNPTS